MTFGGYNFGRYPPPWYIHGASRAENEFWRWAFSESARLSRMTRFHGWNR